VMYEWMQSAAALDNQAARAPGKDRELKKLT